MCALPVLQIAVVIGPQRRIGIRKAIECVLGVVLGVTARADLDRATLDLRDARWPAGV